MILNSRCKQNLSPGVAVMLSSPSAVRQVDGIDDSWEAQVNQAKVNSQKRSEMNICLNSNHIAPSFPPRIVEGIAAISALVFKPGKDLSNHTLVDCDLHVFSQMCSRHTLRVFAYDEYIPVTQFATFSDFF